MGQGREEAGGGQEERRCTERVRREEAEGGREVEMVRGVGDGAGEEHYQVYCKCGQGKVWGRGQGGGDEGDAREVAGRGGGQVNPSRVYGGHWCNQWCEDGT